MSIAGMRILLVEDEPIIAFALLDMLEDRGATVVLAEKVATALAAVEQGEGFDAAILDVNVQGEESYPVARALAARGIRFIFATGYGTAIHPDEFSDMPTISKPYMIGEIERGLAL